MKPDDIIKSVTTIFVFGQDASNMSDDQIFSAIAQVESEIKRLDETEVKPEKLVKRIEGLRKQLAELVKYVDERKDVS